MLQEYIWILRKIRPDVCAGSLLEIEDLANKATPDSGKNNISQKTERPQLEAKRKGAAVWPPGAEREKGGIQEPLLTHS